MPESVCLAPEALTPARVARVYVTASRFASLSSGSRRQSIALARRPPLRARPAAYAPRWAHAAIPVPCRVAAVRLLARVRRFCVARRRNAAGLVGLARPSEAGGPGASRAASRRELPPDEYLTTLGNAVVVARRAGRQVIWFFLPVSPFCTQRKHYTGPGAARRRGERRRERSRVAR